MAKLVGICIIFAFISFVVCVPPSPSPSPRPQRIEYEDPVFPETTDTLILFTTFNTQFFSYFGIPQYVYEDDNNSTQVQRIDFPNDSPRDYGGLYRNDAGKNLPSKLLIVSTILCVILSLLI